ncbi:MAG TPA: flagellar basal body P-ring formation protein FlgA [Ghiorsea sp.]|nr:flagellar basal body P-ring formation protein FlgA [Ghiorsea sp.]HIP06582.1 flagellar basal body P-ring formation protein FlgA [Mariprofundaceae bacterium]
MTKVFLCLFLLLFSFQAYAAEKPVDKALKASLTAFFAAKPMVNNAKAELIGVQHWPNIQGEVRWSLPPLKHLPQRISLIAEQGHGKKLRRFYVPVLVKWMANVITLKQDISARTMLDRSMLSQTQTNIAGLRGRTWSNIADVVGLKSLRNLPKGSVVLSTQMQRPPLIQRGDLVTILVKVAGIQVRAAGIALRSGSRGDRMLVKNVRSKQTLQSIVQDKHTVTVFSGGV